MGSLLLIICIILWGASTFLNKLSVKHMPPALMQVVVGLVFIIYIPIALKLYGINNPLNYKWSTDSIILTIIATIFSITANILLYLYLKDNQNSMSSVTAISLYPLVTLLLSFLFLNETLSLTKIIGMIIMVIGILILSF